MARKRMVYQKIWASTQFGKLSDKAKLLYIGTITIADDEGRLNGNPGYLRGQIFPYEENLSVARVREMLKEISDRVLLLCYKVDGTEYLKHPHWDRYQNLRKDRLTPSDIPDDNQMATKRQPSVGQSAPKGRVGEDRVGKDRVSKGSIASERVLVNYFFELKGWADKDKDFYKKKEIVYARFLRPAKDLVALCDGNLEEAKFCLKKVGDWATSRDLDWSIETVFKKWYDIDGLKPKAKKPYYEGNRLFEMSGKRYVLMPNGEKLEFAGKEKDIEYR